MGATVRTVRHLRLRADSEASVRRAVLKLEDALRCASLPDAGARVLLVRRLDLGLMAAGASPQTLALLLEQRVAAVGGTWVHGVEPSADRADFVFFRDALEARCELALQLADAGSCAAWFWPLAVPEFKPVEGAQANLRRIALAIAALPEAPAALPAWIARLTAAGVAAVLAQAIEPVEAAALLRAAHLSAGASRPRTMPMESPVLPQLASYAQNVDCAERSPHRELTAAFTALPSWVQTLARAGGFVPPVFSMMPASPAIPAVHAGPVAHVAHVTNVPHAPPVAASAGPSRAGNEGTFQEDSDVETPPTFGAPNASAKDVHELPVPKQIKAGAAHLPGQPDSITTETAPEPSLSDRPFLNAAPSVCGGLLFLLPVLQRLGYAAWAQALPEGAAAHIAQQMLVLVLRRLQAPPDDPAWLLTGTSLDDDFGYIDLKAPASWDDPTLAAPRGCAAKDIVALAGQAQPAAALARVWLIACRRWLRRVAGIGVASVVVRPAAIGLTATHADVFFRLSDADMRVRRAGLDLDPGWVPWYGRVVSFHYTEQLASVTAPRTGGVPDGG